MPILFLLVGLLTGCSGKEDENTFSLSETERKKCEETIDQVLYDQYWRYDTDTILFFGGTVPEKTEENQVYFQASKESGYAMDNYGGKSAVVATADLLHFNGERAGLVNFYFIKGNLAGVYYVGGFGQQVASLSNRNLYLANGGFEKFEDRTVTGTFQEKKVPVSLDGFSAVGKDAKGKPIFAVADGQRVKIYGYNNKFVLKKNIGSGGLLPVSVGFLEGDGAYQLAILLAKTSTEESGEHEQVSVASEKVVFYNNAFQKTGELPVEWDSYTCVAGDGTDLVLAQGNIVEYYAKTEGGYEKKSQYDMGHGVTRFLKTDLDGNGVAEYLMTDGMDLYVYQKKENGFMKIWSTHLSMESLMGPITAADLNGDGNKEIYVTDITGTAIRYVLTEKGFVSKNEDIAYGERIYGFDFTGDGKEDYIKITELEDFVQKAYIRQ